MAPTRSGSLTAAAAFDVPASSPLPERVDGYGVLGPHHEVGWRQARLAYVVGQLECRLEVVAGHLSMVAHGVVPGAGSVALHRGNGHGPLPCRRGRRHHCRHHGQQGHTEQHRPRDEVIDGAGGDAAVGPSVVTPSVVSTWRYTPRITPMAPSRSEPLRYSQSPPLRGDAYQGGGGSEQPTPSETPFRPTTMPPARPALRRPGSGGAR